MLAARRAPVSAACPRTARGLAPAARPGRLQQRPGSSVAVRAIDDTNFALNLLASLSAGTVAAGVTIATAENRELQLERLQNLDVPLVAPIGAAIALDAVIHSIPGINVLFSLLSEPTGAAAGVAYMMTLVLSTTAVDPKTLAPEGTILNAEKAKDSRGAIRVPFTDIIPTAIKVVDLKNESSSGAGWTIGEEGLPRLPVNSVLIVLGVGVVILEAASHAPILGAFMPRVLQVAGCLALTGWGFNYLGLNKSSSPSSTPPPPSGSDK